MATTKKTVTKKKPKPIVEKKVCMSCPPERAEQDVKRFYVSKSEVHADGRLPMCQTCIKERCYNEEFDAIDAVKFKDTLRYLDKPYLDAVMQSSISQYNKRYEGQIVQVGNKTIIIGYYFKNINSLSQYAKMDWKQGAEQNALDSIQNGDGIVGIMEDRYELNRTVRDVEQRFYLDNMGDFAVTQEMVQLFGEGYNKDSYRAMWAKYNMLRKSYVERTPFHTESLVSYVRLKVKEEQAIAVGKISDADKWGAAARSAADKAKINPNQLSQSDLQGGLNSFSELFATVEQVRDILTILPKFKYRPNDAPDFLILNYVNYIRSLEGKPLCDYADVYRFYDERKAEYLAQNKGAQAIFQDDPTDSNREAIKEFVTLPADYGEDGGAS